MKLFKSIIICMTTLVYINPAFSMLDLTTAGSSGMIGTGKFYQYVIPTAGGTGLIDSFLKIQDATKTVVQGYNTDASPQYQEVDTWTKAILLSSFPKITLGGITYREIILDIGENVSANNELLSLDDLRLFVSTSNSLTSFNPADNTFSGSPVPIIYTFGTGDWIKLISTFAPGSGGTDMAALIPGFESYDENSYYVYLYSKFGAQGDASNGLGNSDGAEEWSVSTGAAFIPAPGAVLLAVTGIGFVKLLRKRRLL